MLSASMASSPHSELWRMYSSRRRASPPAIATNCNRAPWVGTQIGSLRGNKRSPTESPGCASLRRSELFGLPVRRSVRSYF
jgi:hypothetical protein